MKSIRKNPTGWSTFIPANFFVGILLVWLYADSALGRWRRENCVAIKAGDMGSLLGDPLMAIVPMDLFSTSLLAAVIALGVVDVGLAVLLGRWLFER